MNRTTSRRQFLKTAGAIGLFTIVPRKALGGPGVVAPSEELTKAVIGVGGMGKGHLQYPGARLLAVCDVDRLRLADVMSRCESDVRGYHDFREVLARPDIDIVHIATPPHWHALMSIMAAQAGKDIWCEKPMSRTIHEGMKVVQEVQKHQRIFRLNTWFRFKDDYYGYGSTVAPIKKVVESGALGWPLKVNVSAETGFNFKFQWSGRTDLVPEAVQALSPAPHTHDFPWLLGLRRRRAGRHGPALSGPRAVSAGQGRHQPSEHRGGCAAAAL
jgi:predicted dehydrogenase